MRSFRFLFFSSKQGKQSNKEREQKQLFNYYSESDNGRDVSLSIRGLSKSQSCGGGGDQVGPGFFISNPNVAEWDPCRSIII